MCHMRSATSTSYITPRVCTSGVCTRYVCDASFLWFKYNVSCFSQKVTYDWMAHVYFRTSASAKIPSCTFPSIDFTQSGQSQADHVYVTSMIYGS
jgi:hypothetical protein